MRKSRVRRQPRLATWIACVVALTVFVAPLSLPQAHAQDAMSQARDHYKRGNDLFAKGNYEAAIAEFAQADTLAPSATLEFNIALCYDRLGDRPEALRRYQLYLREVPGASNRVAVEGKIRRIQGELRQESEARDTVAREAAAREAAAREAAAREAAAREAAAREAAAREAATPSPGEQPPVVVAGGAEQSPGYTPPVSQGGSNQDEGAALNDPELARVAAIDVAAIHNQRMAGADSIGYQPNPEQYNAPVEQAPVSSDKGQTSSPIYKQWWFWVVVGVSTVILIDFATSDSSNSNARLLSEPQNQSAAPSSSGIGWRF